MDQAGLAFNDGHPLVFNNLDDALIAFGEVFS
jgi:hypothetical protein